MLAVCDRETVFKATDKMALDELAGNAGLRTPRTFLTDAAQAARTMPPLSLPVVVKPLRSEFPSNDGFRKLRVRLARTRGQVVAALRLLPEGRGLLQRYEPGSLSGIGGIFWEGRIVTAVYQRAVRTWPLDCGEMSFAVTLPRDAQLERAVTRLLAGLGWRGLFHMQFLETAGGQLLIDFNPRVYSSLALALAAGQNLPAVWIDLLLGRTARTAPYRAGLTFRNELLDARALLTSAWAHRRPALAAKLARQATAHAFFEAGDPMPLLAVASILAGKVSSRATGRRPD
jgi:predicted ATP-grasp superfamily ATP-dependent carboligase